MKLRITIDGKVYEAEVEILETDDSAPEYPSYPAAPPPFVPAAMPEPVIGAAQSPDTTNGKNECRSPVTGMVIKVNVEAGQTVQPEEVVAVLESMKMEMQVTAPRMGVVKSVLVAPGSSVKVNQLLVELPLMIGPNASGFCTEEPETMPAFGAGAIPGILFVDHVAIAVRQGELDGQVRAYKMLGFREIHREEVHGSDQVREALLQVGDGPNLIQLLEPLSPDSPVQKMIDKNGGRGGLAHIAFRVKDARHAFDAMKANGFRIIDADPRKGSRGTTVFFVHPKSTEESPFGILIEIVEAPEGR
ncbi:MAG TPA: VOC family protein [Terracidiphilus sp.]